MPLSNQRVSFKVEANKPIVPELKNYQIVYFDINDKGEVSKISYSAIWREAVKKVEKVKNQKM